MSRITFTRRKALESLVALYRRVVPCAGAGEGADRGDSKRLPLSLTPLDEVADIPLFEEEAKKKLPKEGVYGDCGQ